VEQAEPTAVPGEQESLAPEPTAEQTAPAEAADEQSTT
jgi:hypothetical protein